MAVAHIGPGGLTQCLVAEPGDQRDGIHVRFVDPAQAKTGATDDPQCRRQIRRAAWLRRPAQSPRARWYWRQQRPNIAQAIDQI